MGANGRSHVTCTHCSAEVGDGIALCKRCQQTLTVALVNIAAFHTDVLRIQPGQRVKVRGTYQSAPPPSLTPAYDPISAATDVVDNMLIGWCRVLEDDRPQVGHPPVTAARRCAWLEKHVGTIVTLAWSAELLRDAVSAERRLQRILDQADTGWYAGRCGAVLEDERTHDGTTCLCACHHGAPECDVEGGCGAEVTTIEAVRCERGLYAVPGHGWIRCPECGTTHNAAERRDTLITEARDEQAPVSAIARIVVCLFDTEQSVERMSNRIDQWVSRGQLHDLGVRVLDGKPRRVYRLGDVLDLLDRNTRREEVDAC